MTPNLSQTYFRNAEQCAEVARTTNLGRIRDQQLGAEKAWRILGDRAFATESKANERAAGGTHRIPQHDEQD